MGDPTPNGAAGRAATSLSPPWDCARSAARTPRSPGSPRGSRPSWSSHDATAPAAAARRIVAAPLDRRRGVARRRDRRSPGRVRRTRAPERAGVARAAGTGARQSGWRLRFATSRLVPSARPRRPWAVADVGHEGRSRWAWLSDGRYALRAAEAPPGPLRRHRRHARAGAGRQRHHLHAGRRALPAAVPLRRRRAARRRRLRAGERPARGSLVGRAGGLPRLGAREHDAHRLRRRGLLGPESLGGRSAGAARGLPRHARDSSAR